MGHYNKSYGKKSNFWNDKKATDLIPQNFRGVLFISKVGLIVIFQEFGFYFDINSTLWKLWGKNLYNTETWGPARFLPKFVYFCINEDLLYLLNEHNFEFHIAFEKKYSKRTQAQVRFLS